MCCKICDKIYMGGKAGSVMKLTKGTGAQQRSATVLTTSLSKLHSLSDGLAWLQPCFTCKTLPLSAVERLLG